MNISTIDNGGVNPLFAQSQTGAQSGKIDSILSKYDPSNFGKEDMRSLMTEFKQAGLKPGPEVKQALEQAGFDVEALRQSVMQQGGPPGGMPGAAGPDQAAKPSLLEILEEEEDEDDEEEEDDFSDLLNRYIDEGLDSDRINELLGELRSRGYEASGVYLSQQA